MVVINRYGCMVIRDWYWGIFNSVFILFFEIGIIIEIGIYYFVYILVCFWDLFVCIDI